MTKEERSITPKKARLKSVMVQSSVNRLYGTHSISLKKKEELKQKRDNDVIQSTMKSKPEINHRSKEIVMEINGGISESGSFVDKYEDAQEKRRQKME